MLDVVVQIVNYNSLTYTQKCLESVLVEMSKCSLKFRVIVWDNNSDEDFVTWTKEMTDARIKFYCNEQNIGFARAHNEMCKLFDSKYILILNPDIILKNNCIKIMYDFMENHDEAGLCGPRIEMPEYNWFYHKDLFWPRKFVMKEGMEKFCNIDIWTDLKYAEHKPIVGSVLFVRREAFEKVGGFDPNYFLYFEEGDLENMIENIGYKIFFLYNAQVLHFGSKSSRDVNWKIKIFRQSRKYFCEKWKIKKTYWGEMVDIIQDIVLRYYI